MNPKYKCIKSIPGVATPGKVYEATDFDSMITFKSASGEVFKVTTAQLNECFKYVSSISTNRKNNGNNPINS